MNSAGLAALREEIVRRYGCGATFVGDAPVVDVQHGEIVWDGEVLLFELHAPLVGTECYAWAESSTAGGALHVVLRQPAHLSALEAVRRMHEES